MSIFADSAALSRIGIIVVTYQSERHIGPLLRSLAATLDPAHFVVWIWDNASGDATLRVVEEEKPALAFPLHVLPSASNVGFMRGNNAAFRALQAETPCETIILLNPDTVVSAGWWRPLLAELDRPGVGTVAPLLLLPDGTVNACGNGLHFLGQGFVQGYGAPVASLPSEPRLFSGSGAALAFKAATLDALNARLGTADIFWEALFLYADDTDLGWRMRLVGLENRLVLESRVTHDHRFWLKPLADASDRLFYLERNRLLLLFANLKWPTLVVLSPWLVASEIALALGFWKLYPNRLRIWRAVGAEIRSPAFRARRRGLQRGRTVSDRAILRAMTGSLRHGGRPFRGIDGLLDAGLRASHRLLCGTVRW